MPKKKDYFTVGIIPRTKPLKIDKEEQLLEKMKRDFPPEEFERLFMGEFASTPISGADAFCKQLQDYIQERKESLSNLGLYQTGYYLYEERVPRQTELHLLEVWFNTHKHLLQ